MYVVPRKNGSWELRESVTTAAGPRSRTLASFRTLTPETIARARDRATVPLDPAAVRRAAARAGAPIAASDADAAAAQLLEELARGRAPRPMLRALVADALDSTRERTPSDNARAVAPWVAASARERGAALRDLLLLADRLPSPRTPPGRPFPRIASGAA